MGIKVNEMDAQSATVERVCKAHSVIHTKARNRLHLKTVQMLLYCYVNLRLINKCTAELGNFLTSCLENIDDNDDDDIEEEDLIEVETSSAAAAASSSSSAAAAASSSSSAAAAAADSDSD